MLFEHLQTEHVQRGELAYFLRDHRYPLTGEQVIVGQVLEDREQAGQGRRFLVSRRGIRESGDTQLLKHAMKRHIERFCEDFTERRSLQDIPRLQRIPLSPIPRDGKREHYLVEIGLDRCDLRVLHLLQVQRSCGHTSPLTQVDS